MDVIAKILLTIIVTANNLNVASYLDVFMINEYREVHDSTSEQSISIPESPLLLDVVLKRTYLDGEVSEEYIQETIWALEDFWAKYESWQLSDMDEEKIVFEKAIDDISPLLKLNGFFGITDDGTLSIFNGTPEEADIIHSFFQIDIQKLEGKQKLELEQGIPIKSKEVYKETLETLKIYSK